MKNHTVLMVTNAKIKSYCIQVCGFVDHYEQIYRKFILCRRGREKGREGRREGGSEGGGREREGGREVERERGREEVFMFNDIQNSNAKQQILGYQV